MGPGFPAQYGRNVGQEGDQRQGDSEPTENMIEHGAILFRLLSRHQNIMLCLYISDAICLPVTNLRYFCHQLIIAVSSLPITIGGLFQ